VPDSVSATFKQRKRWAQGSCEIQFMPKEKPDMCMDLDWWKQYQIDHPIQCPPSGKNRPLKQRFMRFCFFFNAMYVGTSCCTAFTTIANPVDVFVRAPTTSPTFPGTTPGTRSPPSSTTW